MHVSIDDFHGVSINRDGPASGGRDGQGTRGGGESIRTLERSQLLAGSDWSSFPATEQRTFAFARKLTRHPARISAEDIDTLKHDIATERALFALVYASRCNYMTRISNGFQRSPERDNVFFEYYSEDKETAGPTKRQLRKTPPKRT
jgi:hypothetical protein